jgi:hypothetical protein
MQEALWILRKDARHRRVPLCLFFVLVAVRMVIDILLPRHMELVAVQVILGILFVIAAIGLIYSAVQQERLVGDTQYWLTRPLPWRGIFAAKLLFLGVFILLPALLSTAVALAVNGVSPSGAVSVTLSLGLIGLVMIGAASVTETTVQFVLTVVGFVVSFVLSLSAISILGFYESVNWGGAAGVRSSADSLLFLSMIFVALIWQYRRRSTAKSRALLAVASLLVFIGLPGWHIAFACLEKGEGPGASGPVRLAFDLARGPQENSRDWSYQPGEDIVGVKLPVTMAGMPDGAMLIGERVRTTIDAPDGRHWDSGWRFFGGIIGNENPGAGIHRIMASQDASWLAVNIDRAYFDAVKSTPVHVQSTAAFTMLSMAGVAHLPVPCRSRRIAPGEFCSIRSSDGRLTVFFLSSTGKDNADPGRFYRVRQGNRLLQENLDSSMTTMSAWTYASTTQVMPDFTPSEVEVESRRSSGYFERTISLDQIRLGPHEVGRSTPRIGWGEPVRNIQ